MGNEIDYNSPQLITTLSKHNVLQISCGHTHGKFWREKWEKIFDCFVAAAVLTDVGHVMTWGSGEYGQLASISIIDVIPNAKQSTPLRVKEALLKKRAIHIRYFYISINKLLKKINIKKKYILYHLLSNF